MRAPVSTPQSGPAYDRNRLTPGIVHIGVRNFHRAHLATYLDDLFSLGEGHDWAILGAGVRPADAAMRAALKAQDCVSTVITLDPAAKTVRKVGSMVDFLEVQPDNAAMIAAMARPEIRIVSLTVTEGGYFLHPATGSFDPTHPEIAADAANPEHPVTAFGTILAALRARREAGVVPFTVLSCDNLPRNGKVTKATMVGLARLTDPAIADWVERYVAFPNGMVDRITPATGPREIAIAAALGVSDPVPVTCEPFRQWVLEDRFPAGRPALEKVGVVFSPDVHVFELTKLRILNAGHAILAYPAELLGLGLVHDAMAHPVLRAFLADVLTQEVLPIRPPTPGQSLADYRDVVLDRFANPEIADTPRRLAFDGGARQPKFILPSIRDNLERGVVPRRLILATALWCRYCAGEDEQGRSIAPNDPEWNGLQVVAKEARSDPLRWSGMSRVYGDLSTNQAVVKCFGDALESLWSLGTEETLSRAASTSF
jgi:mannitol 2-dehydrogenase